MKNIIFRGSNQLLKNMKNKRYFVAFLLIINLFLSFNAFSQNFFNNGYDSDKTYFLMDHPTVKNIQRMEYLIDHHILFIGETEIIGVYFYAEKYDYSQSQRYIRDNKLTRFHLQQITGNLNADNVFQTNDLTNNFDVMFSQTKGIFLFGGPDIQPELYGEKNTASIVTDPNRHLFEVSFVFHLLGSSRNPGFKPFLERNPNYFVIGFCLGMQTMNVATGGTMIQDIPSELYHANTPQEIVQLDPEDIHRNYWNEIFNNDDLMPVSFHHLRLTMNSFFPREVKWKKAISPLVLSAHHQAVENLNSCWEVTARSMDGKVIEGIRHKKYKNVFGVQFHPEISSLYENRKKYKFSPGDTARTYHQRIGKSGVKFLKLFWRRISKAIQ